MSMLGVTMLDLVARYKLRKRLHRERDAGRSMSAVVAAGPEIAVADRITDLRRERYHGLEVVAVCLTQESFDVEVAGVPVISAISMTRQMKSKTEPNEGRPQNPPPPNCSPGSN